MMTVKGPFKTSNAYQGDPSAPPKPPRGYQSKNKIYLPEENDDRMVKRNNLQNRYNDYSGKPPRSPYSSSQSQSRSTSRGRPHPGYNALPNRPHPQYQPSRRRNIQPSPSQYRSFGSEPESEVRNNTDIDENYNYNKRETQHMYQPQTASLDRRGDKKTRHVNYEYERMQADTYSGYQSDRVIDERGYDYQIPEWLTAPEQTTQGSTSVKYEPRSAVPKSVYRSDGEYDINENSDTEYRRQGFEVGGTQMEGTLGRDSAGWMTPENYGRPSDSRVKEFSGSLDRYSSRQDYGRYASDVEILSEPERDPPPVPVSAHYYSQPIHDDRRGFVQPNVHDGRNNLPEKSTKVCQ